MVQKEAAKRSKRSASNLKVKSGAGSSQKDKVARKQQRIKDKQEVLKSSPLPGSFSLIRQATRILSRFWKPLGGIVLVYLILNIVFASGLSSLSSNVNDIKSNLSNNQANQFSQAVSGFGSLIGTAGTGSSSQSGSILQSLLIVLGSLVIIWALRQLLAGKQISIKQAYYSATTPLIPFLIVIFVIILQLLPVTLATAALGVVLTSVFSSNVLVTILFSVAFVCLAAWSIYMLSSSIFALYIVTLPDMQPRQALRSAKQLVRFKRWQLMRRVVFLPIFILSVMGILIIPLILSATFLVIPIFYILSAVSILFVHTYLYNLYRSMLT